MKKVSFGEILIEISKALSTDHRIRSSNSRSNPRSNSRSNSRSKSIEQIYSNRNFIEFSKHFNMSISSILITHEMF